jgi:cation:H+ antiporter
MEILGDIGWLIAGFVALIWGAGRLVEGASSLARRFAISELMIGLTVVAIGTSLPEFAVNLVASFRGHGAILYGNVIGSNLVNLLVILGLSGMIFPLAIRHSTAWREVPMSLLATLLFILLVNDRAEPGLSWMDGVLLLLGFLLFMGYVFYSLRQRSGKEAETVQTAPNGSFTRAVVQIVLGMILLVAGGEIVVRNAVSMATAWGMSHSLIGLTIVATGTSLPELATSVVAAWKKRSDIAIGNIIGSNIFNFCFVAGSVALVQPASYDPAFNASLWLLAGATMFLFLAPFIGKRYVLERWQSVVLFATYVIALLYQILKETGSF